MRRLLDDAFAHHVWATLRLIDACLSLAPAPLETTVPGTYGSIINTMRHLVGADCFYLFVLTDGRVSEIDEERMDLGDLQAAMESNGASWAQLLREALDADVEIREVDEDDGFEKLAPVGIRLAQALHHGTDHRSQICTALTTLGVEPPAIDAWDFGLEDGRVVEIPPTS
jgi:uncharacterized damage-inducible protein DinB